MTRVLRAETKASEVLSAAVADARSEARRVLARAEAQVQARLEAAVEQGRSLGRAELAAALVSLACERERQLAQLEHSVVEVTLLAARRLAGEALVADPVLIVGIVRPLLQRLRRAHAVTLRVHPLDAPVLERHLAPLREGLDASLGLALEPDPEITRGGCFLESDVGAVDARFETRIEALSAALARRT